MLSKYLHHIVAVTNPVVKIENPRAKLVVHMVVVAVPNNGVKAALKRLYMMAARQCS